MKKSKIAKVITKIVKSKIFAFALGAVIFGSLSAGAVTYFASGDVSYDNSISGLKSTDVQSAIDELYNACFPPGPLDGTAFEDVPVVTSGDGLYKDEYEEGRYFYRGANPNNYITFNDEDAGWRIMSVECDGTIKIIRNEGLNHTTWWAEFNVDEFNDWSDSPRCIYLNETYYDTLTDAAKNQIQAHDFGVESGTYLNYENMSAFIADENKTKWNGNIALNSMSEAVRMNSDTTKCGNFELHFASGKGHANGCEKTNWIFSTNTNVWWTLSNGGSSGSAYVIKNYGGYAYSNQSADMRPTLYLKSDIILSGTGTESDPYVIIN